jgi:hypothetical protein
MGRQWSVSAMTVAKALLAVVLVLTALSLTAHGLRYAYGDEHFVEFARLFNLSGEANIPTWFTSIILFSSAALLSGIAEEERQRGERRFLRHWWVLAMGFTYISLDEVAQIHELTIEPLRDRLHTRGLLYDAWVIPASVLVVLVLVTYRRFLARLPPRTRLGLIWSGAIYVSGALGVEVVSAYVADYHPDETVLRGALATLEDFLEMCGIVLLIYTLMTYRAPGAEGKLPAAGPT